jgi:response regulator RpfG family c-di-GMP phosphodiesterase
MAQPAVVLVAASPGGLAVARELLGEEFQLVAVHSASDALRRLAQGGIDLVLAGLHFDDSSMAALVDAVKKDPSTRAIPVVCCRFLPSMLPQASLLAVRQVCDALGAEAFVDVLEIQQREGAKAAAERLRFALQRGCLGVSAP